MSSRVPTFLAVAGLAGSAFIAAAQPSITRIGSAAPNQMTSDGQLVVLNSLAGVVRWNRSASPAVQIVPGSTGSTYCSNDGSVMAATIPNSDGLGGLPTDLDISARWTASNGWQSIGLFSGAGECGSINTPYDISATGRYIVGGGWLGSCSGFRAFTHDAQTGVMTNLGSLGGRATRANGVSADGSVVVGFDESALTGVRRPAVWINGVEQVLPTGDENSEGGEVYAVNDAGTVAIGSSFEYPGHLVRWTRSGNDWTAQDLGTIAGFPSYIPEWYELEAVNAAAMSEDGSVIVGHIVYRDFSFRERGSFIYTDELGVVDLYDYLAAQNTPGLSDFVSPFGGAPLGFGLDVSDDGNTIVGTGLGSPAWLVELDGAPCGSPIAFGAAETQSIERDGFVVLNSAVAGTAPLTFTWTRDGQPVVDGDTAWGTTFFGATTSQIRFFPAHCEDAGMYQCVTTNPCGEIVSAEIVLTVDGCDGCAADFDGDGFVTGLDFDAYVGAFEAGDMASDFDGDGFVTGLDFDAYVGAFEAGC